MNQNETLKKIIFKASSPVLALSLLLFAFQNCSEVNFTEKLDTASLGDPVIPVCRDVNAPEVKPKLKWDWYASLDKTKVENYPYFSQVMSTPMVADLDGDGGPEVVFTTWTTQSSEWFSDTLSSSAYSKNGVLRIVNGKTGATIKSIGAQALAPFGTTSPLLVDLDGDGKIEILYSHYLGAKVIALNHDGSLRWEFTPSSSVISSRGLSATDFNADGRADVILGKQVITESPAKAPQVLFDLKGTSASPIQFGYNLDPSKPFNKNIIGKNGVFDQQGGFLFPLAADLYYAAADLDLTVPGLEVIGAGNGLIKLYSGLNGNLLKSVDLTGVSELMCPSGKVGGGAPTVGDFDGDSSTIEVAVATGKFLSIFSQNLDLIAKYETQDCSSLKTSISSFDFNGDKKPEILYADEEFLRIFEMKDGQLRVVWQIANPSGTLDEYPVVVDVDGNGSSELIVSANNYAVAGLYKDPEELAFKDEALLITGVRAFESKVAGNWMPTRKIWNQVEYNPSMFTERGLASAVSVPDSSYVLRTFRRNTQLAEFEPICK